MKVNAKRTKVSVIIPNWNGYELLKDCLPSLKKQTFTDFEVVVVDNGSTDKSVSYIKNKFPEIKLIELSNNTGFAPAVNLGIKICVGDYMILLNNDTRVDKKFIEYLVKTADKYPDVGLVAAKMLNFYNPKIIDSAGDYIDVVGHANNIGMGQIDNIDFNKPGYTFLVTGGGSLIKRQVFETIGFLDNYYFAYMEDVDFGLRAQIAGLKAYYEPKAIVYHKHKATSSRIKPFAEYLQYRNMTATIIKDFPNSVIAANLLKIILVNINTLFFFVKRGLWKEGLKAELYILYHFKRLLTERQRIQSSMKVSPEYIAENIRPRQITFYWRSLKALRHNLEF